MASQFSLLQTRRFLPMFLTQFLGALNDNVFKQALILLFTYQAASLSSLSPSVLNNLSAMLFILPYFLFSATAGQIADKYEKSQLTRLIKLFEIGIMALATIGFLLHHFVLLFVALFLMGTHSAFFGPIKYAILPQLLQEDELVGGNALFEMGTSLAILIGMIIGGVVMVESGDNLLGISLLVLSIAGLGYLSSRQVPARSVGNANLRVDWNIFRTSTQALRYLKGLPSVFWTVLGISWFWYYGATFLTQIPQFTKQTLHGSEPVVTFLLTVFSVGIGLGSLMCERLAGHRVNLKLVPIGAIGLCLFAIDLYFSVHQLQPASHDQSLNLILSQAEYYRTFLDLFCIGVFGGFYIVPLYAYMQAHSPHSHRARVIAANNILNALFMVASAIVAMLALSELKLGLDELFLLTSGLSIVVSALVIYKVKHLSKGDPVTFEPEAGLEQSTSPQSTIDTMHDKTMHDKSQNP